MSSEMSYEEAINLKGYLEKKSTNLLSSYQKRFFEIIDGRYLTYRGKEKDKDTKAKIDIAGISMPESVEKKVFKFNSTEREFQLKAKDKEEKEKWINALKVVKMKLNEMGIVAENKPNLESLDNIIRFQEQSSESNINSSNVDTNINNNTNDGEEKVNEANSYLNPNMNINVNVNANLNSNINRDTEEDKNIDVNVNNEVPNLNLDTNKGLNVNVEVGPQANIDSYNDINKKIISNEEELNKNENNYNEVKANIIPNMEINIREDKNINLNENPKPNVESDINMNKKSNINIDTNYNSNLSKEELLKLNGVERLIDINDKTINTRFYHNFMFKKNNDYFQKNWFCVFSPRPLFDYYYKEDDIDLEQNMQKDWLRFDTLYCFKCDENNRNSESTNLVNIDKVEKEDIDNKYYLYLYDKDKKTEFFCESRGDREDWFEVIKNSSRTAKEYKVSITKHPRNVEPLNSIFTNELEFYKKLEREKNAIILNRDRLIDLDLFESNIKKLTFLIESTIDGCNSNSPPKMDLLKAYTMNMNKEIYLIINSFWERMHDEINIYEILNMSTLLFHMWEKLYLQDIDDLNFFTNGKALTKLYIKKTYRNILSLIETILSIEREKKALKDEEGKYCTKGPNDLFELFTITFESIKDYKNKYIYESVLNLFYTCFYQYLIGVGTVLIYPGITIDKEFLLAMSNNCITMKKLINALTEEIKKTNVLKEEEINESLELEKIDTILNGILQKSINSFTNYFFDELGKFFKNSYFMSLDASKIIMISNELLEPYKKYMNNLVYKKTSKEMLKLALYYYINLILSLKPTENIDKIKEKIKKDIEILSNGYESIIGNELTTSTIKILNDILDFLNMNLDTISNSCLLLRQYIGPSFNLSLVQNLISLKNDLKEEDKNNLIGKCKEVLDKYQEDGNELNYFQLIEIEQKDNKERIKGETNIFNLDDFKYDIEENNGNIEIIKNQEEDKDNSNHIFCEGYIDQKITFNWIPHYFKTNNEYIYYYKDKNSQKIQNKIPIKNILRIRTLKDKKFIMEVNVASSEEDKKNYIYRKIYKYSFKNNDEKNKCIEEIRKQMKILIMGGEKIFKIEIPIRKKVITNYFNLPSINKDINYMRKKVLEYMEKEKYFKPQKKSESLKEKSEKVKANINSAQNLGFGEKFKLWFINSVEGLKAEIDDYLKDK